MSCCGKDPKKVQEIIIHGSDVVPTGEFPVMMSPDDTFEIRQGQPMFTELGKDGKVHIFRDVSEPDVVKDNRPVLARLFANFLKGRFGK